MKKYRLQWIAQPLVGFSNRGCKNVTDDYTYQRMQKREIGNYLLDSLRGFYERDDVSRITTGNKKQTITVKKQKRFLLDTMKNLHLKFLAEERFISYSLFCSLCPFWVVVPTLSDYDTCMCKMHENLAFIVQKLHQLWVVNTIDLDELVKSITCEPKNIKCIYG